MDCPELLPILEVVSLDASREQFWPIHEIPPKKGEMIIFSRVVDALAYLTIYFHITTKMGKEKCSGIKR